MSVLDEIKELEQDIRATLGESFNYGFFAGVFFAFFIVAFISGIYEGFAIYKIIGIIMNLSGFLIMKVKQGLYETKTFHNTLDSANDDECTCGEECTCEENHEDKVEHL